MVSIPVFKDAVTVPVDIQQSSRRIWGLRLVNTTAAVAYLQIFGLAAPDVTLGATIPAWVIRLQPNESLVWPFGDAVTIGGNGMSVAGTTTPTGAVTAAISVGALTA
jgi:hypothetical protein